METFGKLSNFVIRFTAMSVFSIICVHSRKFVSVYC